jgi:hypothetical protein
MLHLRHQWGVSNSLLLRGGATAMSRRAGGLDMKTGKRDANRNGSRGDDVAAPHESICIPLSRRARLMGASALAGGALRGLAVAAGMVTVFGGAPAFAQCSSNAGGTLSGSCAAAAATGASSTAVA